jgi:cell division protein FtsI (penicillin-binding protein 3)
MIDEPGAGKHYGGQVAAPVFATVTANALRSMNVAPDSSVTNIIIPAGSEQENM